jgi:hypothetical protein
MIFSAQYFLSAWVIFLGKFLNYKSSRLKEHTHLKMEAVFTSTESHNGDDATQDDGSNHVTRDMREKKGWLRERNLKGTPTLKSVGTTARPSFLVTTLLALVGAEAASVFREFVSVRPAHGTVLRNLLTILCCILCRLVVSSFSDFCFYFVS